jgi:hypothetical protein
MNLTFDHWSASRWNIPSRWKLRNQLLNSFPEHPQGFNEKVRYRMAHDRNPMIKDFADKFQMRNKVFELCGPEYLAKVYDASERPEKIEWDALKDNFVCKVNHGSGGLIGVWDGVEPEAKLPQTINGLGWTRWWVKPENFEVQMCIKMVNYWLKQNFAYRNYTYPEWAYSKIKRKVYVEELLVNGDGSIATPLSFYIFGGVVKVIRISGRTLDSNRTFSFADRAWKELQISASGLENYDKINPFPRKPDNFSKMIEMAELLSGHIDFARVDLYNVDGRIIFSEVTNYPAAGSSLWLPATFEKQMGEWWI